MVLGSDGGALTRPAAEWFKQNNVLRGDVRCASDGRRYVAGRLVRRSDADTDGSEVDVGATPAADLWVVSYMRDLNLTSSNAIKFRGVLDQLTEADQSYVFALPRPVLREFAFQVCQFDLAEDGSWRARRMIECIREIWAKYQSGEVVAENVFYEIFVELTEGLESVLAPVTLNDMTMFFAVPPGGGSFTAEAMVERFNTLAAWLEAIKTQAAESETSCELVALQLLRRGSPFNPLQTSDEPD